jgi:hypothetical protein
MRVEKYQVLPYSTSLWRFEEVVFQSVNLLVGDSGAGKTRLMNTLFNGAHSAVNSETLYSAEWHWTFMHKGVRYRWDLQAGSDGHRPRIDTESLTDLTRGVELIRRSAADFFFKGKELPKLSRFSTGISILKDEAEIAPVHEAFSSIMRRRFFADDLARAYKFISLDPDRYGGGRMSVGDIFGIVGDGAINLKAFALSRYHPKIWRVLIQQFREVFPFIEDVVVQDLKKLQPGLMVPGFVPAICLRERNVNGLVSAEDISSGMQKVFMVLMDLLLLPKEGVYLLDEYENSLGLSAINFLPELLLDHADGCQFFLTSHHPYIINRLPPSHWYIFHRSGSEVRIRYGEANAERYGRSKQQWFTQLLNDPFFKVGVE